MEGDLFSIYASSFLDLFQSTPSAWRETRGHGLQQVTCRISIHSLRMEGDDLQSALILSQRYFNPLPPHGGRHKSGQLSISHTLFQSTPSAWRETHYAALVLVSADISIHSLRMEGDLPVFVDADFFVKFQSTPSAWRETPQIGMRRSYLSHFNPLPPHGGRP